MLYTARQTTFVLLCWRYSLTSPVLSHVIPSAKPRVHEKIYPVRRTVLLERCTTIVLSITNNRTHTAIPTWITSALIQHILLKIHTSVKQTGKTCKVSDIYRGFPVQISGVTANKLSEISHSGHLNNNSAQQWAAFTCVHRTFRIISEQISSVHWPISHVKVELYCEVVCDVIISK
jgi:hypothetical protein